MTIALVALTVVVVFVLVGLSDLRRIKAIGCIERAERLRIRFSSLRHRLVMHAGSGEMTPEERNAFVFLYRATAFMLRHPKRYRMFSAVFCSIHLDTNVPPSPPALRPQDISTSMRPLMLEYVTACNDVVQQFANPLLLLLASVSGESVVDAVANAGRRLRELEEKKRRVEQWRDVGARALGGGGGLVDAAV